jgi:energy-coupling factor transport system permease protein
MHTLTWLIWLCCAVLALVLAPGPPYALLALLSTALVAAAWGRSAPDSRPYALFARLGALVLLGYIVFSVVTVGGARGQTVLLRLPAARLPDALGGVVLGGPITGEALALGASRGLVIWALLAAFGAFNALVNHYRLLRLAPRSLFHAGLAVTIAVTFVPSLVRAAGEIREAQRARGHRFGGPRSWLPLAAPLLAGSLEKSVQLAEALDARGFGRTRPDERAMLRHQLAVLASVLLLGAGAFGWLYYGRGAAPWSAAAGAAGALTLLLAMRSLGRLVTRTAYRRERWRRRDTLVVALAAACIVALAALRAQSGLALVYNPFPRVGWPPFDLRAGIALLALAAPAPFAPAGAPEGARRRASR